MRVTDPWLKFLKMTCHPRISALHFPQCYLDVRSGQFADRQGSCLKTLAWWDAIQPEAMTRQSIQKLIQQVMFAFFGN